MEFADYINVAQILVSIALTGVILLQAKGNDLGSMMGGGSSGGSFRTRRGMEKTLFQLTIVLAVVFLVISAWSVRAASSSATGRAVLLHLQPLAPARCPGSGRAGAFASSGTSRSMTHRERPCPAPGGTYVEGGDAAAGTHQPAVQQREPDGRRRSLR